MFLLPVQKTGPDERARFSEAWVTIICISALAINFSTYFFIFQQFPGKNKTKDRLLRESPKKNSTIRSIF
jgi:hypothetical protein